MTTNELNFTLANDNRNVPLERLISIDMRANHSIKLNCNQVVEFLVQAEMCTIVLLSAHGDRLLVLWGLTYAATSKKAT